MKLSEIYLYLHYPHKMVDRLFVTSHDSQNQFESIYNMLHMRQRNREQSSQNEKQTHERGNSKRDREGKSKN